jgi:lysophospholipase L1-like esterase
MNVRLVLVLGVWAAACSSEATPSTQSGPGSGAGGRMAGAGGSTLVGGSGPIPDGGGGADSSGQELVDAQDAKPEAEEAGTAPKDASADAVVRVPSFIVVLGSSTAAGFGLADPATSWVQRYATYLSANLPGSRVTNLAVSGYSTYQIQPTGTINPIGQPAVDPAHNVTAALALKPDAIIVNLPSNDAAMGVPVEDTMTNFKTVAAKATEANVLIWIGTSQPRQLTAAGLALILGLRDRINQEFGDRALDFFTPLAAADGTPLAMYNQGDGIHPNAEGHRLLFEQVRMADLPAVIAKPANGSRD